MIRNFFMHPRKSQHKAASLCIIGINHKRTSKFLASNRQIGSPNPVPRIKSSNWVKRSNTKSCLSLRIPFPVSIISNKSAAPCKIVIF